ncbi:MAG: DUF4037 domain-containing protein [Anaerolineae bacterium]|nr:DUF4037 domain-containing protein [Anaerolineae bacterium]
MFPPEIQPVIDELLPLCRALGEGKYAVSIGGSYGKRTFDAASDLDFRLFCERRSDDPAASAALQVAIERWAQKGVIIDGCWVRTIADIEAQLDRWEAGEGEPIDLVWAIWGYYVVTDAYNQAVIEDPYGVLAGWRERLSTYSPRLKQAILDKHLRSLRYWRPDYHYLHKVEQGDVVFLASITAHLVHNTLQVLFALNETYYPGDGNNLHFVRHFEVAPERAVERIENILYPGKGPEAFTVQYTELIALIDDIERLVPADLSAHTKRDWMATGDGETDAGQVIGGPTAH